VEFLQQEWIVFLILKVPLQNAVEGALDEDSVVEGGDAEVLFNVPRGLPATGRGTVHDVVGHQKKGLELQTRNNSTYRTRI
jgi:hypothetical protein